ncbi:dihydrodipicolinate synthase family protein [Pendulispora rubella]|uniref:Dihydrodipicolinate synthase family protein n=1 Tax=Pendulispora rubella TaxID=2741070 RepID=A0ABZ2LHV7_9BACT
MSPTITLPTAEGSLERYTLRAPRDWSIPHVPARTRIAYAAAHVVADPLADNTPGAPATIDWDATMAFRRHLWQCGLRVADAMDTSQRNMGLDWPATRELIRRSAAEARSFGPNVDALLACGAGTDHLGAGSPDLDAIVAAYLEQIAVIEDTGARVILMASRHLAACARGPGDYHRVYGALLRQLTRPVILHWLGDMFDPALRGYWGSQDLAEATESFLALVRDYASRIDGVKVSLLDREHEIRLRQRLPKGVRLYTGDDFNYPDLILGDAQGHSDALLGIFDPIAPAASVALAALDAGDTAGYAAAFEPTLPLARWLFAAPTYHYKTGIVFLAWLCGHQDAFVMVNGAHSARSILHLTEAFRRADVADLFPDPFLAASRMRALLATAGVVA